MNLDATATDRRLQAMKASRLPHERPWRDCFDFSYPLRGSGLNGQTLTAQQAQDRIALNIVDPTSTEAARDLSANIQGGMTPANSIWFELTVQGSDEEGDEWLSDSGRSLWSNIHAANFDSESFEGNLDGVIAGWFVLYVIEDEQLGGFNFDQWPIGNCYVGASRPGGPIDTIFREYMLTVEQAVNAFGLEALPKVMQDQYRIGKIGETHNFVHAIEPRSMYVPDAVLAKNMRFSSCQYHADTKMTVQERGYHEFPCVVPRWMRIPGTDYATGPMFDALPAVKRLNELGRMELAAADIAVAGMWKAVDDGVLNPKTVKVGPRKIITMASMDSMEALETGSDFNVNWTMQDKLQAQIKRMMMADQLPPADGPVKTAYEYSVRVQMLRQALGPIYGRLQAEYLKPLIELCFAIAFRASQRLWSMGMPGVFNPPPESIANREFSVKFTSPLARSQKLEDVTAMDSFENRLINAAAVRPQDMDVYDFDQGNRERAKLLGINGKLIRSADELAELRQARQQQAQQQQMQEAALPGVTEASKAMGQQAVNG